MLKAKIFPLNLIMIVSLVGCSTLPQAKPTIKNPQLTAGSPIEVYFAPGTVTTVVVAEINHATSSIKMMAYSLTSKPVIAALVAAKLKGVDVQLIWDKGASGSNPIGLKQMLTGKVAIWLDGSHPIAHAKVLIIDGTEVITGSWNFSAQADVNSENLLVIKNGVLAGRYIENFNKHLVHSVKQ